MREIWARRIVVFTGLIVLILSIVFALNQNPSKLTETEKSLTTEFSESAVFDPERLERGRQIYQQQTCAHCHSIAGQGNPRNPLDGVGEKHTAEVLYNWITGANAVQGLLPDSVKKMKQGYQKLTDDELNALVIYMQSLRR